jgi:hypothetical protein
MRIADRVTKYCAALCRFHIVRRVARQGETKRVAFRQMSECGSLVNAYTRYCHCVYLRPKHVRGRYNTRLTGPKRPQRTLTAGARPSLKGRLASVAVHTPPALAHASPCPRLLLGSSLSPTRMPTNASEPVREHGVGVRRGWRVRCHRRAQKWPRKWWWCAARASHGPRPPAGDGWTMSISGDKELPHLIQPVAQALSADRSLVSKLTRQRVCHEGF